MRYVNPTNDLAFKKVLGNNENIHILEGFIKDLFSIEPDGLTVENPYNIKAYKEMIKNEDTFRLRTTISDIAAVMSFADYRSELQIRKDNYFDERSLYYPLNKFVSRYKVTPDEKSAFARLRPIYSMNILGFEHYTEDDDALRIFQLYDPQRKKHFSKRLLFLGYFELLKPDVETENQRQWQNYFLQKPLSKDAPKYIYDALQIIDRANMDEEELEMITQTEYLQSVYDGQLEYAKEEGKIEIAVEMLQEGESIEKITKYTKLPPETIKQLRRQLH